MKYMKHGETISVNLGNGYSVFCMARWDTDDRCYKLDLYLQDNEIELLELLCDSVDTPIYAKKNTLYAEIIKHVESLIEERYFTKHIKKYEFEMKCIDIGLETLDAELFQKEYDAIWD